MKRIIGILMLAFGIFAAMPAAAAGIDWVKVDQALGKKGEMLPGGVHKVGMPRTDLHVTLDNIDLKPGFALGSHVEFMPSAGGALLMGDLVLTEDEIEPVMKKLIDGGIEITALHNHLLRTSPPIFYMHIGGRGDPVKLAESLHAALILSGTPIAAPASASPQPALDLDTTGIDKALGANGKASGGVYHFGFPRAETIRSEGIVVPPEMGTATAINFQPTGGGKAAITGDFVLLAREVNPVLKALRANGIEVTALHTHMLYEKPRLFYMHFWADDDAAKLAKGLRAALDKVNLARAKK